MFQPGVFQSDAFQIGAGIASAVVVETPQVGRLEDKRKRRRLERKARREALESLQGEDSKRFDGISWEAAKALQEASRRALKPVVEVAQEPAKVLESEIRAIDLDSIALRAEAVAAQNREYALRIMHALEEDEMMIVAMMASLACKN